MLPAIQTALAGYTERTADIARLSDRIAKQSQDVTGNMVGLIVNQRAAEANLAVARVADETMQSLLHIIA
jgi:hypothetical protein